MEGLLKIFNFKKKKSSTLPFVHSVAIEILSNADAPIFRSNTNYQS